MLKHIGGLSSSHKVKLIFFFLPEADTLNNSCSNDKNLTEDAWVKGLASSSFPANPMQINIGSVLQFVVMETCLLHAEA